MTKEKTSLKDKYIALIHAATDEDDLLMIEKSLTNFIDYINSVIMMVFGTEIIKERYSSEERRPYLQELDLKRHTCHEACISSLSFLNKLCQLYGVEQVAENVNLNDRYDVADYIGDFILQVYSNEIHESRKGLCEAIALSQNGKCYNDTELKKMFERDGDCRR